MTDRATMRRSRRNGTTSNNVRVIPHPPGVAPQGSRIRDVVQARQPTIPVVPAAVPIPRSRLRPQASEDPVLSALQTGFEGLQGSVDNLTRSIRQASGLDAADEELEALRDANAALRAQLTDALAELEVLRAPHPVTEQVDPELVEPSGDDLPDATA